MYLGNLLVNLIGLL